MLRLLPKSLNKKHVVVRAKTTAMVSFSGNFYLLFFSFWGKERRNHISSLTPNGTNIWKVKIVAILLINNF